MEHDHYQESERRMSIDSREYVQPREWDQRIEPELDQIETENNRRRPYVREDSRPPNTVKNRQEWDNQEYNNREWDNRNRGNRGPPHETWDRQNDSEQGDRGSIDEEWRQYNSNRSMDSWQCEDARRQRWPEFPERTRSVPKSISSQRDEDEVRRPIETVKPLEIEVVPPIVHESPPEVKKETILGKRPSESCEDAPEVKKPCIEEPPIDDDLSEISDDADEILNREDVSKFFKSFLLRKFINIHVRWRI